VTSRPLNAATAVLKPIVPKTSVPPSNCLDKFWDLILNSRGGLSARQLLRKLKISKEQL
jgi:hypothetical protein